MAKFKSGDVVVVTGASSGIGRATALEFARAGARLTLVARNEEKLAGVREECRALGAEALVHAADVTDAAALTDAVLRTVATYGRLDAWINNAGVGAVGLFSETPLEAHARVLETNLFGYLNGAYAALAQFRTAGRGVLINVASISAYVPQPTTAAYVTSKFAVRGLTYALRQDLALERTRDVHACLVHPQVVDTDVFDHMANYSGSAVDLKLPATSPERVARAILKVARRPRREVVVGAFGAFAVLGHRLFPGLAEWLMIRLGRWYYARRPHDRGRKSGNLFESGK